MGAVVSLANGLLEVWFSYQEHKNSLIRIQEEQAEAAEADGAAAAAPRPALARDRPRRPYVGVASRQVCQTSATPLSPRPASTGCGCPGR